MQLAEAFIPASAFSPARVWSRYNNGWNQELHKSYVRVQLVKLLCGAILAWLHVWLDSARCLLSHANEGHQYLLSFKRLIFCGRSREIRRHIEKSWALRNRFRSVSHLDIAWYLYSIYICGLALSHACRKLPLSRNVSYSRSISHRTCLWVYQVFCLLCDSMLVTSVFDEMARISNRWLADGQRLPQRHDVWRSHTWRTRGLSITVPRTDNYCGQQHGVEISRQVRHRLPRLVSKSRIIGRSVIYLFVGLSVSATRLTWHRCLKNIPVRHLREQSVLVVLVHRTLKRLEDSGNFFSVKKYLSCRQYVGLCKSKNQFQGRIPFPSRVL